MELSNNNNKENNNFDFLRFIAASLVIVIHSNILLGIKPPNYIAYLPNGVSIFFIISGFLITKSWLNNPDILDFLKNRLLRILPGLVAVVILTSLVLGPLVTTLSLKEYFKNSEFWTYLSNIFIYKTHYNLPGVFKDLPFAGRVNGALWTLPLEFLMYFLIAAFGVFKLLNKKWLHPTIFVVSLFLLLHVYVGSSAEKEFILCRGSEFFQYMLYFFIGSFIYLQKEKIKLSFPIFLTAVAVWIICINTPINWYSQYITLPYIVLYVAYAKIPLFNNWGRYGDFSYGMYLWAFPIQQTVVNLFKNHLNLNSYILVTYALSLILGILSFHFIEKHALRLKKIKLKELIKNNPKIVYLKPQDNTSTETILQ